MPEWGVEDREEELQAGITQARRVGSEEERTTTGARGLSCRHETPAIEIEAMPAVMWTRKLPPKCFGCRGKGCTATQRIRWSGGCHVLMFWEHKREFAAAAHGALEHRNLNFQEKDMPKQRTSWETGVIVRHGDLATEACHQCRTRAAPPAPNRGRSARFEFRVFYVR